MAHAQKPDFVSRRYGRVHLNLLAAEVCASSVVTLDTPCSEVVWRVQATHSIRQFPLHFSYRASLRAITFQLEPTDNYSTKFQFKKIETFSVQRIIAVALLFIQTHILQRLVYIGSVRNYVSCDIYIYIYIYNFVLVVDLTLLYRTFIMNPTFSILSSVRANELHMELTSFCTSKYLSYIRKSYAVVYCILASRNLNCENRCWQTAIIAFRLHSYARSRPRKRKKFNSEGVAMPANTDAHNIPLGLGIYPRSQKYKGLNGGRDTNNETFQSSPEPLQSESAGSDDAPTRGGTDYWR